MSQVAEHLDQGRLDVAGLKANWELAKRDPFVFQANFVYTLDQHALESGEDPIRQFPYWRPHIQYLTCLWLANPLLAVKKSRQMTVTWWAVVMALWDCLKTGRLWMLQSKREEDAIGDADAGDGLLGRAMFILRHLPGAQWLCAEGRDWRMAKGNRIVFPGWNSVAWAIPQGAAIIRQRTASGILSDEAGFQDEFSDSYVAAMPCVRGGGRFVAVSTAHPGFFEELTEDRVGLGED